MANPIKLMLVASLAVLMPSSVVGAQEACSGAEEGIVFGEVVPVGGGKATLELLCRDGQLTAVPIDAPSGSAGIDRGGPPISLDGTSPEAGSVEEIPEGSESAEAPADPDATGRHAAGVAGQAPTESITQSPAEPAMAPSTLPPVGERGDENANKPGVSADAADGGRKPGEAKSDARIAPADTGEPAASAASPATSPEMVRVPGAIASAARSVVPGITFKNVVLSRDGPSTVYGLAGENQSGRGVAVDVDQAGTVLRVDRQIGMSEIPPEILRLSEAVLPDARTEKAMMSLRPNFQSFFVLSGQTARNEDFALEIRADGRSLSFLDER
ncbi:hypothetical protein [Aureimonas sp. SA4125]|uniref:hypothetical protein n=1 Tax=Aureimonas sp. SA4125 TaxID=2826993 RepID=UPI001CC6A55C|nr:hypothetical protein [Aureimonas sp. SA4125]